ncbi:hypothetical protein CLV30_12472 [Haloactinopolyspora alba]|uniref:Uncharacterized protein n=1 Tax=Haloactinopolyspora alba TaxID=648780 RepID=A0A2P8DID1_9ACTN|nr:hypothetical protein [Haloactinopolyspora alba]PSK96984.1 hypothetical protein CLV30_12472 [Haloactinopolyspora alba]
MSEQTIAMAFAGFAVLATLVSWVFYLVVGKSLWDMRKFFRGKPGDRDHSRENQ